MAFDSLARVEYNQVDNDGKIYAKIDWLTVIFNDCSMNDVLRWLTLEDSVSDFVANVFEQSRGYDEIFKFIYNGVMLETSSFNFYGQDLSVVLFDVIVPKIRLELSGSALDYLRSIGINMDSHRFVTPDLPEGGTYHFTRCDWAFDFINYCPDFVDRMLEHVRIHRLPSERVPLAGTKSAISCRVITGGQKTIYLGSPQSDRMLRVYDKRMQYVDLKTGVYKVLNPYNNPDSWFRIEWQTRNRLAHSMVIDREFEFKHILRMVFDTYAFADATFDARAKARPVVPFWLELFNWNEIEKRIVQKVDLVQFKTPADRITDTFELVMIRTFILYVSLYGTKHLVQRCNDYLRSLEGDDPVAFRRRMAFLNKVNELPLDISDSSDGLTALFGRLRFVMRGLK